MEELHLTNAEQRYFGDLFIFCSGSPKATKVSSIKACELFRTSKLSNEILRQIFDLVTCTSGCELGRKEFYAALKLIAAAQSGAAVTLDIMTSTLDVPLPKFTWTNEEPRSDLIQLSDSAVPIRNSTSASSTASDSPTPTNSVQDKGWASSTAWPGLVCEEQRQLLGTEEESSDRHSSEEEADTQRGSAEESEDLYSMTVEQKEYYTAQFRSLQPATNGLLAGTVARLFFEKSRLPMNDLRKIWQLADVTKDGALSLEEFNIAMHLVVLRRNHIPLPETLPVTLLPPPPPPMRPPREEHHQSPSPCQASSSSDHRGSKQWTTFVDSPTNSISSPGPKPVNFDFRKSAVEKDPKIFHPVPVRVTPETNHHPTDDDHNRRIDSEAVQNENHVLNGKKALLQSLSTDNADIRPIQRPQPRKPPPGPGAIPPPPYPLPDEFSGPFSLPTNTAPKKEPPPPPPPRPYRTHARSSSLDLNRLGRSASLQAPPAPPPRVSPNSTSPKKLTSQRSEEVPGSGFPGGEDEGIAEIDGAPRRQGAFQVYRKHPNQCSPAEATATTANYTSMKKIEVQNLALARLCLELNQELLQVQEEKHLLQVKLEKLQERYQE